jgi:hypothetical protein
MRSNAGAEAPSQVQKSSVFYCGISWGRKERNPAFELNFDAVKAHFAGRFHT